MSSLIRTRWAAIGAAIAVTLGAGGLGIVNAAISTGERAVFVPITPCRVLDTRPAEAVPGRQTPLGAGETFTQNTYGNNGLCNATIPTDATGLSLNVTTTNATSGTFITIWPNGPGRPVASSLNPAPNQPPTPNAVVTDINPAGQFNIFNLAGTLDILIDINGYFVDHNHDDRYYTRAQIDTAAAQDAAQDKWISIDPMAASVGAGASLNMGYLSEAGINLPGGGSDGPGFDLGFTVPPDHTPNTPLTVEFLWHIDQTGCTVNLRTNYSSITRAGRLPAFSTSFSIPVTSVTSPNNTTIRTSVNVGTATFGLAPGDAVILGFWRSSDSDTCTATARITGIRVLYT